MKILLNQIDLEKAVKEYLKNIINIDTRNVSLCFFGGGRSSEYGVNVYFNARKTSTPEPIVEEPEEALRSTEKPKAVESTTPEESKPTEPLMESTEQVVEPTEVPPVKRMSLFANME